jgi:hypothetical protein
MNDQLGDVKQVTAPVDKAAAARPMFVTIVCILAFIAFPFAVWKVISGSYKHGPGWFPAVTLASQLFAVCCVAGYWLMRRRAVIAYACFFPLSQAAILASGFWSPVATIGPALFIALGVAYYRRMR